MKMLLQSTVLVLAGAVLGVGASRIVAPAPALAQTPMMMHGTDSANCPMMGSMMQQTHGPADQMMMNGMMNMHRSMSTMHLTGNSDRDFMTMMIPHHEAAVTMAKAEIQYGKDPRVIALAKNIIASQQKEIDEMQSWLK